jgi:hypothetical protein
MRRALVAILAMSSAAVVAQPRTFLDGYLAGLRIEGSPDGAMHFLSGVAEGKPAPPIQQAAIESIVQHMRQRADPANVSIVADPNPTNGDSHSAFRDVINACHMEQPYRLSAVEIRVGWLCGNRLEWFTFFDFTNDQFPHVLLVRAIVPPIAPTPARSPEVHQ